MISERKEGEMCCCLFRIVAQVYELLFWLGVCLFENRRCLEVKCDIMRTILVWKFQGNLIILVIWKGSDVFISQKKKLSNVIDTNTNYVKVPWYEPNKNMQAYNYITISFGCKFLRTKLVKDDLTVLHSKHVYLYDGK